MGETINLFGNNQVRNAESMPSRFTARLASWVSRLKLKSNKVQFSVAVILQILIESFFYQAAFDIGRKNYKILFNPFFFDDVRFFIRLDKTDKIKQCMQY